MKKMFLCVFFLIHLGNFVHAVSLEGELSYFLESIKARPQGLILEFKKSGGRLMVVRGDVRDPGIIPEPVNYGGKIEINFGETMSLLERHSFFTFVPLPKGENVQAFEVKYEADLRFMGKGLDTKKWRIEAYGSGNDVELKIVRLEVSGPMNVVSAKGNDLPTIEPPIEDKSVGMPSKPIAFSTVSPEEKESPWFLVVAGVVALVMAAVGVFWRLKKSSS